MQETAAQRAERNRVAEMQAAVRMQQEREAAAAALALETARQVCTNLHKRNARALNWDSGVSMYPEPKPPWYQTLLSAIRKVFACCDYSRASMPLS